MHSTQKVEKIFFQHSSKESEISFRKVLKDKYSEDGHHPKVNWE